ncbi:MAG: diguanylate cyclase [Acidobacteria bacterium]|nr:diguanylate cyclase [Acidobacteriota bacterium]
MLDPRTTRPIDLASWRAGTVTRPVNGRFLVDAEGMILAFDRGAESFTGWTALEVVGRGEELGVYTEPDEDGFRRFEPRALYEGSLGSVSRATPRTISICAKDGTRWQVDVILTPAASPPGAVSVELLRARGPVGAEAPAATATATERWPGIDTLTGLPSAVEFESRLADAFALSRAEGVPFSILLVEVDGYDAFVEALGPGLGDAMLRHAARVIHGAVRGHDMTARLDGAQFGVLLEGTARTAGRAVGGRVRQAVEYHPFEVDQGRQLRLTVTVGGACYPADGDTLDELTRRSREALAEARRLGRNRVWIYARRPRVRIITPVFADGQENDPIGLSYDISNSGLFVECEPRVAEGARLGLHFGVPGQVEPVRVIGRVARVSRGGESSPSGGPGLGIEFESYGQRDRAIIERYLREGLAEE